MSGNFPSVAEIAALLGNPNPARATMLTALMGGRALTAGELSFAAHVSPQTASGHLAMLRDARLVTLRKQGRHAYYRLASPAVGHMLEGIMAVAVNGPPRYRPRWQGDEALRTARTCYDHLAGRLGVAMAGALERGDYLVLGEDGGEVTIKGHAFLTDWGLDVVAIGHGRRTFCRPCLDWSERRPHIAGAVGAALARHCFDLDWIRRITDTRAVAITEKGRRGF